MSIRECIDGFSKILFWDIDLNEADMDKYPAHFIQRVLEYGSMDDWRLLRSYYGLPKIVEECKQLRTLDLFVFLISAPFLIQILKNTDAIIPDNRTPHLRCFSKNPGMKWNLLLLMRWRKYDSLVFIALIIMFTRSQKSILFIRKGLEGAFLSKKVVYVLKKQFTLQYLRQSFWPFHPFLLPLSSWWKIRHRHDIGSDSHWDSEAHTSFLLSSSTNSKTINYEHMVTKFRKQKVSIRWVS